VTYNVWQSLIFVGDGGTRGRVLNFFPDFLNFFVVWQSLFFSGDGGAWDHARERERERERERAVLGTAWDHEREGERERELY